MKLKLIKTAAEIQIPGVKVEFVLEESKLVEVIFKPQDQETSYSIRPGENYVNCVKVFSRVEFDTKTVFRITGKFMGLTVTEDFDEKSSAETRLSELKNVDRFCDLKIVETTVRVDESGAVTTDIPF